MGNNPISKIDPDGGACIDSQGRIIPCPDGYENYNGPTRETMNFGSGTSTGSNTYNVLDEVVLNGNSGVGNIANMINSTSLFGNMGLDAFKRTIPNLKKSDFLLGHIDPKYITDFKNSIPNSAMGNVYERGSSDALRSLSKLNKGLDYASRGATVLSYYSTLDYALSEKYNDAGAEFVHSTGSAVSGGVGGFVGTAIYESIWYVGDNWLVKQKWYNQAIFGIHSDVYRKRANNYGF